MIRANWSKNYKNDNKSIVSENVFNKDVKVINKRVINVGNKVALLGLWSYEGIVGESVVFKNDDIKMMMDSEIKKIVVDSNLVYNKESERTMLIERNDLYTIVNFNLSW